MPSNAENSEKAEKAAASMTGDALKRQTSVIAGIKASITKGPAWQRGAATKA
jgi:hypothetical protein